jgi:hypothetical protein
LEFEVKLNAPLLVNLQEFSKAVIPRMPQSYTELMNPGVLAQMKLYATSVVKFFDSYQRLELSVRTLHAIIKLYHIDNPNDAYAEVIRRYRGYLKMYAPTREYLRTRILADVNFLAPKVATREYRNFVDLTQNDRFQQYRWYINDFPPLASLVTASTSFRR